jgi:hypothetical protein
MNRKPDNAIVVRNRYEDGSCVYNVELREIYNGEIQYLAQIGAESEEQANQIAAIINAASYVQAAS